MRIKLIHFALVIMLLCSNCQVTQATNKCIPVLLPQKEYSYRAKPLRLTGSFKPDSTLEDIDFHGFTMEIPKNWKYERVFNGHSIVISRDNRKILIGLRTDEPYEFNPASIKMIGCDNFESKQSMEEKSARVFINDLYLFTKDQLEEPSSYWQYYILLMKADFFGYSHNLIHYQGDNLEAFSHNTDPRYVCVKSGILIELTVFLNKIDSRYLCITADFVDDAFFENFLDMLDQLNT